MKRILSFSLALAFSLTLLKAQVIDLGAQEKALNAPNYKCEATIYEYHNIKDYRSSLSGVDIEVFNKTTQTQVLNIQNHKLNTFSLNLDHGNEYVIMVRKNGYFIKRVTAKIGIDGCIACFSGLHTFTPLAENDMNSIANLKLFMRRVNEGDRIALPEVNFEGKSANITEKTAQSLDDLATFLKDNTNIIGQLEVHTDARGTSDENQVLSEKRSKAIMDYLQLSGVSSNDIYSKGYGERKIVNHCTDDVNCGETQHAKNRRVIFWLQAIIGDNQIAEKPLVDILAGDLKTIVVQSKTPSGAFDVVENPSNDVKKEEEQPIPAPKAEIKPKELAKLDKVEQAIPSNNGEEQLFGTSSFNNVTVTEDNKKLCDVDGKAITQNELLADPADDMEIGGLQISRNTMDRVPGTSNISQGAMVTYDEDGKSIRRSGRATLVPKTYDGYKVELFRSVDELDNDHKIFIHHGKVFLDDTGDAFSYMIGAFETEEGADKFMRTVIKPRYPEAKVIRYKNGKRKE